MVELLQLVTQFLEFRVYHGKRFPALGAPRLVGLERLREPAELRGQIVNCPVVFGDLDADYPDMRIHELIGKAIDALARVAGP